MNRPARLYAASGALLLAAAVACQQLLPAAPDFLLGLLYGWAGAAIILAGMGEMQLALQWDDLLMVLAVALAAGLLASVLPGRSAARTSPVAALAVD